MPEPVEIVVAALFLLMAYRAFRSGTAADIAIAVSQCAGVLLLLTGFHRSACWLLLITAAAYLLSQLLTGARSISLLLPLAGAAATLVLLFG